MNKMKKMKKTLGLMLAIMAFQVQAGPFTDQLSVCLVKNTSEADKHTLLKWVYVAMSSHPGVMSMSNVTEAQREQMSKETAELFTVLLTERCKNETAQAIQYEGQAAFGKSFEVLGQVAMKGLMTDPSVVSYINRLQTYVDVQKLEQVFGPKQ